VSGFDFPPFEQDYTFVSLRHAQEYPFNEGRLASSRGLDIEASQFEQHFKEEHVERSNVLHAVLVGQGSYLVGPLARYSLNFDRLSPLAQEAARSAGLAATCRNPFQSIIVRSVELVYACDEALRVMEQYEPPATPAAALTLRAGEGCACTEAPRGVLYHRYRLDADGTIREAKIVPPTSQNQPQIESDLRRFVEANLALDTPALTSKCEQSVRNYDPCISCATHFLKLEIDRA
jgi:coenzyme F420-reducing hydrogenase alpha subunit